MTPLLLLLPLSLALVQGIEPNPTQMPPVVTPSTLAPVASSIVPNVNISATTLASVDGSVVPHVNISTTTTANVPPMVDKKTTTTTTPATTTTTTTTPATTTTTTTTTTVAPNTTTTSTTTPSPVTTTVAPPTNKVGNWTVKQNGTVCILLRMNLRVNVTLDKGKNKTYHEVVLPTNDQAVATGVCGSLEQNITITWPVVNQTADMLTIHFVKNASESRYTMHHMELLLSDFNLTKPVMLIHEHTEYSTGLENSYRCLKKQELPLKIIQQNDTVGFATVSDLQFQAFKSGNGTTFGLAKDCSFDTPDVVPIAVGCALAGLVVIVLVAYLVGRRRSHSQGYVSM